MYADHKSALFLAKKHLKAHPYRAFALILSLSLLIFLPLFSHGMVDHLNHHLMSRARQTPLVMVQGGNHYERLFNTLFFRGKSLQDLKWERVQILQKTHAPSISPIHTGHHAQGIPLIGITLNYLKHRDLRVEKGRNPAILGEILVGSAIAKARGLKVGAHLQSDLQEITHFSGAYPIRLKVVGILAPTQSVDDHALFADIKTSWLLDGLYHGHQDVDTDEAEPNPGLFLFQDITAENLSQFHIHGNEAERPLSAILIFPPDQAQHDMLLAAYQDDATVDLIRPPILMDEFLALILNIRDMMGLSFIIVCGSALGLMLLILSLTLELRQGEFTLFARLGSPRKTIFWMVFYENLAIFIITLALAFLLNQGAYGYLQTQLSL